MSFFSCNRTDNKCPGPIANNPTQGLAERVCIQTTKVFDSGIKQFQLQQQTITLTDLTPANPVTPLTFVSCSTDTGVDTTITDLVIDRFDDRPNFARVTGNVNIPITVYYTDANGVEGRGVGIITVPQDVIMFVPQPAVIPFRVEAFGSAVCSDGTYVSGSTFTIDACVTLILKVVVTAQILIPSYGYCPIPELQDYNTEVCAGTGDLPLYPMSCGCR